MSKQTMKLGSEWIVKKAIEVADSQRMIVVGGWNAGNWIRQIEKIAELAKRELNDVTYLINGEEMADFRSVFVWFNEVWLIA